MTTEIAQEYVVGFLYDDDGYVVLIRKDRPAWQRGLLNGVGGKVEPGEKPADAMRREFVEEAGLDVPDWDWFATLRCLNGAVVHFFRAFTDRATRSSARTMTTERLEVRLAVAVPSTADVIPNLRWLVPLGAHRRGARGGPERFAPLAVEEMRVS